MAALQRCGLPGAWAGARQWRILETGFGRGAHFLQAWRDWKDDAARPGLLHFVAIEAQPVSAEEVVQSFSGDARLEALAVELARQWFGVLPGTHRLVFESGRVTLTLHVNETRGVLRREPFVVDSVILDEDDIDLMALKAIGRHCRRGTRVSLATPASSETARRDFAQCGFAFDSSGEWQQAVFAPDWAPKNPLPAEGVMPSRCVVIGAGLAGAAVASSLALRGWRVAVLDAAAAPAAGASGVLVGLIAPHYSADDSLLSRLTRGGVRATMEQARLLLQEGVDWQKCGVLEQREEHVADSAFPEQGFAWNRPADATQLKLSGLNDESAIWHEHAGWIKPSALVRAWLAMDGISLRTSIRVQRIVRDGDDWVLLDEEGSELERAPLVIVAAALRSNSLAGSTLPLQPVRGQVSWNTEHPSAQLPPFALNGNGHFISHVPMDGASAWFAGSTFDRDDTNLDPRSADHAANLERLQSLSPGVATQLELDFTSKTVQAWTGIRCASSNRRPIVTEVQPGLWISAAMGSRGLTYCTLCAELLAARLHAEPLPMQSKLADSLAGNSTPSAS